ncbi:hypothetical protein CCACVL1_20063, partial [Corchorus capsularis]
MEGLFSESEPSIISTELKFSPSIHISPEVMDRLQGCQAVWNPSGGRAGDLRCGGEPGPVAGTRRLVGAADYPARSGVPRYNFPGRYWKPMHVDGEE